MQFVKPGVVPDELVEALGRLRTCRYVFGSDLFKNPNQNIIAKIKKLCHFFCRCNSSVA